MEDEKKEVFVDDVISPQQPLQEDTKLTINDFELLQTIGKGSIGKVIEVSSFLSAL